MEFLSLQLSKPYSLVMRRNVSRLQSVCREIQKIFYEERFRACSFMGK